MVVPKYLNCHPNICNTQIRNGELSLDGVGLATLDLEKMYINMTEEVGVAACKNYLETRIPVGMDEDLVSPRSLLKALKICIQKNYFEFDETIYHQTGGVGTGIKLAPPFACLGVGDFEEKFFSSENDFEEMILL